MDRRDLETVGALALKRPGRWGNDPYRKTRLHPRPTRPKASCITPPPKTRPTTVAEYIADAPKEARKKLREMRACIRRAAPGAREELKWRLPAYSYRRILVMFGGFKHHIGFYPTPAVLRAFAKELAKFTQAKGSVQFPLDQPLPVALIRRMVAFRVRLSVAADGKWRT